MVSRRGQADMDVDRLSLEKERGMYDPDEHEKITQRMYEGGEPKYTEKEWAEWQSGNAPVEEDVDWLGIVWRGRGGVLHDAAHKADPDVVCLVAGLPDRSLNAPLQDALEDRGRVALHLLLELGLEVDGPGQRDHEHLSDRRSLDQLAQHFD